MTPRVELAKAPVEVTHRVTAALRGFLDVHVDRLVQIGGELGDLDDVIRVAVLRGGKLLRPRFAYWGAIGAAGTDDDSLVRAAGSLELLHAFALIHDDLMDGSDLRRGHPAAHRQLQRLHEQSVWSGSPEHFGRSVAILVGDLLLVLSEEMLATAGLPPDALARARRVYAGMRIELMAGQYLDIAAQTRGFASLDAALRVARFKSGKYTVEAPLHFGAAIAGAPPEVFAAYSAFALPLGEAFQLRDDVLGVFGDESVTGKPSGEDLREGKRTALVALACERATSAQHRTLNQLGRPDVDVAAVRGVIVDTGALESVESMIADRTHGALTALDAAPLEPAAVDTLRALAVAATIRSC